jgi:hypothetical protein
VKATAHAQQHPVRRSATRRIPAKLVLPFDHNLQPMSHIERDSRRRPLLAAGSGVLPWPDRRRHSPTDSNLMAALFRMDGSGWRRQHFKPRDGDLDSRFAALAINSYCPTQRRWWVAWVFRIHPNGRNRCTVELMLSARSRGATRLLCAAVGEFGRYICGLPVISNVLPVMAKNDPITGVGDSRTRIPCSTHVGPICGLADPDSQCRRPSDSTRELNPNRFSHKHGN